MKSVVVLAALVASMVSLQGCGSSGDDEPVAPICNYAQTDNFVCPGHGNREVLLSMFNDLEKGDVKEVRFAGNIMNISTATWSTMAIMDEATCSGSVNFAVPGNEQPSPGNLNARISLSLEVEQDCKSPQKYVITFWDPAGPEDTFSNQWVQADVIERHVESTNISCPTHLAGLFAEPSGQAWSVSTEGTALTIAPHDSEETQTIEATLDASSCSATVNFASLRPDLGLDLRAEFRLSVSPGQTVQEAAASPLWYIMMTDPTETYRSGPLRQWVQLPSSVITA